MHIPTTLNSKRLKEDMELGRKTNEGTEKAERWRAALSQIHSSMEFPNKTHYNKSNKYTLKIKYFELVISEKCL